MSKKSVPTMVDRGQEKITPAASDMSLKKKELLSSALERTSEWYAYILLKPMLWCLLCQMYLTCFYSVHLLPFLGYKGLKHEFNYLITGYVLRRFQVMSIFKLEKLPFLYIR